MDVGGEDAVNDNETADVHVFADREDHVLEFSFYREIVVVCEGKELFDRCGALVKDYLEDAADEFLEGLVLSDEVRLCVYFDHSGRVVSVVEHDVDNALSCDPARLFSGDGESLFAKDLYSLVEIAVCLCESLFAFHHTAAGLCSEIGNHFCSYSHFILHSARGACKF